MFEKRVKIEWTSVFPSEHEAEVFIKEVAALHAKRYGTDVVEEALLENGRYLGTTNHIKVTVS